MSTYTKEQFISDVKAEAVALREHATKEERERLKIQFLMPSSPQFCVYGLLTGNCNSPRAKELIRLCAPVLLYNQHSLEIATMDRLEGEGRKGFSYLSPIEKYIQGPSNNDNLISYLRGETDDLNL